MNTKERHQRMFEGYWEQQLKTNESPDAIWQGGVRRADPPAGRECSDALLPIAKCGPEMDRGAHLWNPRAANAFTTPM